MTKRITPVPPRLKKIVQQEIRDVRRLMGREEYVIHTNYLDDDKNTEDTNTPIHAEMHVDRRYLTASLNVYPVVIRLWNEKRMSDDELQETIAHEVAHIATEQMKDLIFSPFKNEGEAKDAWENLTTLVGRLLHSLNDTSRTRAR